LFLINCTPLGAPNFSFPWSFLCFLGKNEKVGKEGVHDEVYWGKHVDEYLRWYAGGSQ
jgi:hypothetical protein